MEKDTVIWAEHSDIIFNIEEMMKGKWENTYPMSFTISSINNENRCMVWMWEKVAHKNNWSFNRPYKCLH